MEEDYKIVDNIIYTRNVKHKPDDRGLGWVYYECLLKNKNILSQIDGLTGKEDTFGDLLQRSIRAANGLKACGVQYGDVVCVCSSNHFDSCVPYIASMFVGAKIAALDPTMSLSHAAYLFEMVVPKLIFVGEESVAWFEKILKKLERTALIVVFGQTQTHLSFLQFSRLSFDENEFTPVTAKSVNDVAVIMFTSGTSGLPKGVCHTHHSILSAEVNSMILGVPSPVMFGSDCPFWNNFVFCLNYSIQTGIPRILYPKFVYDNPWEIFRRRITLAFLNLTELMMLCNTPKPNFVDTKFLEIITTGGSPVSANQILKIKMRFENTSLRIIYGQTEVFDAITCFDMTNIKHCQIMSKKMKSCGLPKMGINYKVVDLETEVPLGPNQKGEIRIKTETQLSGYYNTNSRDIWDDEGWLKTGDYGYYDEDCCFYIVDRINQMFKYRNWHINPTVLEGILEQHPAVFKAIVVGTPHEIDCHHPVAVIQLHHDAIVSAVEIEKYLEERVEEWEQLRGGVRFLDNLPINSIGKIDRLTLTKMVENNEI